MLVRKEGSPSGPLAPSPDQFWRGRGLPLGALCVFRDPFSGRGVSSQGCLAGPLPQPGFLGGFSPALVRYARALKGDEAWEEAQGSEVLPDPQNHSDWRGSEGE